MKKKSKPSIDEKAAVQALEYLLAAGYVSKKRLYKENFFRGIFFSLGSVIGATLIIALLLWALSLFNNLPLIGNVVESIQHTIDVKERN